MPARTQRGEEPGKPVGIWIRVSTEDQAKGESPEHHEKRARLYADMKGWRVREVYHLEAVSGKSVMAHPECQRMLEHVRRGHISALIFSKLARLARNTRELLDFADIFRECDADLVSLQEAIDTTSPAGRLFYTMIAAMAQWEREEISERVAASVPIRARLGKSTGGAAPFGYRWENRQLIPDPNEAPVRRLVHELFLEHHRKRTVARLLNERGYRTRSGAKFTDTTVARLIQDPTPKGLRRANYTKSLGDGKAWKLKPRDQWVEVPVEPILPVELWEQCNALLEGRKNGKKPAKKAVHLFAGLAVCHCGPKMYVPSNMKKYVCPKCRNRIAITDLEAVFHEQLRDFVFSPDDVAAHLDQADEVLKAKEEALRTLETDRGTVRRQMEKVYNAYMTDELSVHGFGSQYRPLEERLKQIEEELPRLQAEADFMKVQLLSRDEILSGARDLYDRWKSLAWDEKRQIIESITETIVIGKDDVEIHLCYLPSSSQDTAKKQRFNTDSSRPRASRARGRRASARRARS